MATGKTSDMTILLRRRRLKEAIDQGFLDAALASDETTVKNAGHALNVMCCDTPVDVTPIGGINR